MIEVISVIYFNSNPALTPLQKGPFQLAKNAEKYEILMLILKKFSGGIAPKHPYWEQATAPLSRPQPRGHLDY